MNQLFGSVRTTAPGVFESQRVALLVEVLLLRNRIMNQNLVMVAPSFQAGCGGIDMFAGSLSFVSAGSSCSIPYFAVANAKGNVFQWRSVLCVQKRPQHMETLQKKIQQLKTQDLAIPVKWLRESCNDTGCFW
ncbi:conjugal transfer protein TraH [Providencia rettgeri]